MVTTGDNQDMSVLEVGCGGGIFTREIWRQFGCHVTGIDINERAITMAKRHCPDAEFACVSIGTLVSSSSS